MKFDVLAPFVCNETWLYLKKWPSGSRPIHSLQVEKTTVDDILLLRSHILTPLTVGSMPGNSSRWGSKLTCFSCRYPCTRTQRNHVFV